MPQAPLFAGLVLPPGPPAAPHLPPGLPGRPVVQALPPLTSRYRQVRAFAQLVDQHFRTLKSVRAYADQLRITPNYLNALCRRLLHQTASEVLHGRIVAEAQQLLAQSGASVAAIAAALGFADASYFARYFKKYVRQTPLAFRQAGAGALPAAQPAEARADFRPEPASGPRA